VKVGRPQRSGQCGEDFCKEHFGIEEDETYEIKSCAYRNYQFVARCIQLLRFFTKYFVIVRYRREHKTITRGPRKGLRVPCERCSGNFLAIAGWEQFSVGGGGTPGQIVSNDEAFGLPSFEDHKKKLFKDKTGLDDPEDARPIG